MDSLHFALGAPLWRSPGFHRFNRRQWPALSRDHLALPRSVVARIVAAQSANELQEHLAALVDEARSARMRADKARARFMRLTESVEQMNLRAAAEIKAGNEDAARQLIKEKRNVMAALELSKKRAALLEEFATKLNQVISLKETRLMASLSLGELSDTTTTSSVRIVPPKDRVLIVPPKERESGRDDQCSS